MNHIKQILVLVALVLVALILGTGMPGAGHAQKVRFVVVGDSRGSNNGVNNSILSEIVQVTLDEDVDFILFPGDLVKGSSNQAMLESQLATWRDTMQPLYDAGIHVYPCRGNHDKHSKAAWDNVFTGSYALPGNGPIEEENITFFFTYENILVVGLDEYVTDGRINQRWLDAQFKSSNQPHVFVFGHEPAFEVGHRDCLDDHGNDRNTFWNSIKAEGGRIYFCGHDHFYNHARIDDGDGNEDNDIHQFIVGTSGAELYHWDKEYDGDNGPWTPRFVYHDMEYGYVLVEINGFNVTVTWKHRISAGVYKEAGDKFSYTVKTSIPIVHE